MGGNSLPADALQLLRVLRPELCDDVSCQPGFGRSAQKLAEEYWENATQSTKTPSTVSEAPDDNDEARDIGGDAESSETLSTADASTAGSSATLTSSRKKLDVYTGKLPLPKMKDPRWHESWALPQGLRIMHFVWNDTQCLKIEKHLDKLKELADASHFKPHTVDRTALRSKYFFGFGYTYGAQINEKHGELLLPPGLVDPIPEWIHEGLIQRLEEKGKVPQGWINSAVVNDYKPGGMIVSHIDPPHLFARPIFIASFFATGRLVFGAVFAFARNSHFLQPPKYVAELPRGSLCSMNGFAADGITHGIRPEDLTGRRVSIVLRHCFEDGPRLSVNIDRPLPPAQRSAKRDVLEDFLADVDDGSPFLLQYLARFCEKFETVSQVRASFNDACTRSGKSDGSKFFEDLGIRKLGHQRLFQRWFKSH